MLALKRLTAPENLAVILIQEVDRTFPHSGPLVGNSGTHVKRRSDNHSDPDQMGGGESLFLELVTLMREDRVPMWSGLSSV